MKQTNLLFFFTLGLVLILSSCSKSSVQDPGGNNNTSDSLNIIGFVNNLSGCKLKFVNASANFTRVFYNYNANNRVEKIFSNYLNDTSEISYNSNNQISKITIRNFAGYGVTAFLQ